MLAVFRSEERAREAGALEFRRRDTPPLLHGSGSGAFLSPHNRPPAWGTLAAMSDQTTDEAASASWEALEDRIDRIIERNRTLASENKALRQAQRSWSVERADLVRRNELAKSRIEAMINRLKLLADE